MNGTRISSPQYKGLFSAGQAGATPMPRAAISSPLNSGKTDAWTPAPDPAVIVRSDCVEIRRIHLFFSLWHDDEALENTTQHRHFFERPLDFDTLHRVLSERLRFA